MTSHRGSRSHPGRIGRKRARVVLWGGHPRDRWFGSLEDREAAWRERLAAILPVGGLPTFSSSDLAGGLKVMVVGGSVLSDFDFEGHRRESLERFERHAHAMAMRRRSVPLLWEGDQA